MARKIAALFLSLAVLAPALGVLATLQGCTKRAQVRQEERVEQRTQDRYERRRGDE